MTTDNPQTYMEAWLAGPGGQQFYTRTYPAADTPRAVLVFVHGFADHVGRHQLAHRYLANKGITIFTWDQRGFGRTALDTAHKSKDSAYGKTSHVFEMQDIEFWVQHAKKEHPNLALFLAGQSMGGGLSLAFPTQARPPPSKETVDILAGVIAMSPLILQTMPASRLLRKAGGAVAIFAPWLPCPAAVPPENLSHDPAVNNTVESDPLIQKHGTFKGLWDMLNRGEKVLYEGYKSWPKRLPLLILHGTHDKVTSPKASQEFINKLDAEDKKLSLYEGAYHELTNEPDGVKERFWDECAAWISVHLPPADGSQLAKL